MIATAVHSPIFEAVQRAITDLSGGFNPRNLFAANEPGYLYDLDDLSTVFLDSAGTTAASVNGLVGLVLDKSQGATLGAELLSNPDFSSGTTGWTTVAGSFTATSGIARLQNTSATASIAYASVSTVAGRMYRLDITAIPGTTTANFRIGTTLNGTEILTTTAVSGNLPRYFFATSATTFITLRTASAVDGDYVDFDAVTVKELPGNHAYQSTTGSKPILRGTPTGANLVANGTFDTDTDWTKGTGWAIGSGVATKTAGTAAAISQPYSLVAGRVYRIEYTVSGATAGTCAGALFSGTQVTGPLVGTNGRRTEYLTALSGNNSFGVTSNATFNGSIDNLVIYDVSAGSVTAPYDLQFDGVDDFLQTAAVDFTATDKVTVCHGVRKLSDAAQGVVVEAADITTASGSFALAAPAGASNTLAFRSKGTILSTTQSNFTAPFTAVMCGLGDISGDTATLRVNGSQVSQNTADQGTGNYGNHILYFGRRSGTSNPYNGLEYSSVCIGRLLTAAELANVERWVARKTGVTL